MLNEQTQPHYPNPNLEFVHAFDIMELLFGLDTEVECSTAAGNTHKVSLRYGNSLHCVINLGWNKRSRKRVVT
jgi:hypothetical protein